MTFRDEIAALKSRIARAQSERDTWRASGRQEKYLEAYCTLEALELELERLRQAGLNRLRQADLNRLPSARIEPPAQDVPVPDPPEGELMAALAITFRDGMYHLGPYRYDRLADAVRYARLQRTHAR